MLSLSICLAEASEPIYGRSPDEIADDNILALVGMVPPEYPKLKNQIFELLVNGEKKQALNLIKATMDDLQKQIDSRAARQDSRYFSRAASEYRRFETLRDYVEWYGRGK